jgi:hypothetical protein
MKFEQLARELNEITEEKYVNYSQEYTYLRRLGDVCDLLLKNHANSSTSELLLTFCEKFAHAKLIDPHTDLGTPGPIIHTIEKINGYDTVLEKSIDRQPTYQALLLIQRQLNALKNNMSNPTHSR